MVELNPTVLRSPLCHWAFRRMFWGFLLVYLLSIQGPEFSIGSVDVRLTAAVVGWFIIASSLTLILDLAPMIKRLRWMVIVFAALSLFHVRLPGEGVDILAHWPVFLFAVLVVALQVRIVWDLCGLIQSVAATTGNSLLVAKAHRRRKTYACFWVGLLLLSPAIYHLPKAADTFVPVVLFGVYTTITCFILGLMRSAEKMCWDHSQEPVEPLL